MQKPIVLSGRTLALSNENPSTLTFSISMAIDAPGVRTSGKGGKSVLVDKITLTVNAKGDYAAGQTFIGVGSANISASTPRVFCNGKQLLTEGDKTSVTCNGTITTTASGATAPGQAKVDVTISDGVQKNVDASKS